MTNLPAKIDHNISVCPHPLRAERQDVVVPMGLSVEQMVRYAQPDPRLRPHAHVHVNGYYIEPDRWGQVVPVVGDAVEIRMVPRGGGGGGKDPLRTVLTIAVMVAATVTGQWYAYSYLGLQGATAAAVSAATTAAVATAGRMAINAIAPPPSQSMDEGIDYQNDKPAYSIERARNRARRYQPIRKLIGTHRIVPDLAAIPYTEIVGNDYYLRMVFCWGYGPLDIDEIKIGETLLWTKSGGVQNFDEVEIEHRQGFSDDAPLTLYPNVIKETNLNIELIGGDGWYTRTTEPDTDEIGVDIVFPNGLVEFDDRGNRNSVNVEFEIQYAPTGTSDWSIAGGTTITKNEQNVGLDVYYIYDSPDYVQIDQNTGRIFVNKKLKTTSYGIARCYTECTSTDERGNCSTGSLVVNDIRKSSNITGLSPSKLDSNTVTVSSGDLYVPYVYFRQSSTSIIARSIRFVPEQKGQFDVRVRRITSNSSDAQVQDDSYWKTQRSITQDDPVKRSDVALTAVKIKATDQLNGVIDELNGICKSILPSWDSSQGSWVENATNDPAAGVRTLLQGNGNASPLPDSRIDITGLQDFAEYCVSEGWTCNLVIESRESVRKQMVDVCSTARAAPSLVDGVWGVVVDKERTKIAQHVTPRNSWGYQGNKEFAEIPHAFKVRFTDETSGYRQNTRIVYDDGYDESNATKFEEIQLPGVTSPDLAWRHGRRHLAQVRLRPENHSFKMDPEHILANRGQLIKFAHTVPMFGIKSARVKSVTDTDSDSDIEQVALDDICPMESGKSYFIRFRHPDGSSSLHEVVTDPGEQNTLTFVTPIADADAPEDGDLAMFGESDLESVDLIIKSIEPTNDLNAKITAVDAAPGVHTADSDTIPAFDSQITEVAFPDPPQPQLENIRSGALVLYRDQDGSLRPRIVVDFSIDSNKEDLVGAFEIHYKEVSEEKFTSLGNINFEARTFDVREVEQGLSYDIIFRSISRDGERYSNWQVISGHEVVGKTAPPFDVANLQAETTNWIDSGSKVYGIRLSWDDVPDKDLWRYEVRLADANWGVRNSDLVARPLDSHCQIPISTAKTHTFYVKAIDTAGNWSENATSVSVTIDAPQAVADLSSKFDKSTLVLSWDEREGTWPIANFEIRRGASTWDASTVVSTVKASRLSEVPDWGGVMEWWVAGIDVAGNYGTPASLDVNITAPDKPQDVSTKIFGNNLLVYWTNSPNTLPIEYTELWRDNSKDASYGDATNQYVNDNTGTWSNYMEPRAGFFAYFLVPVDTAGNRGSVAKITAYIDEPPDFLLQTEFHTDFFGPRSGVVRAEPEQMHHAEFDGADGYIEIFDDAALDITTAITLSAWVKVFSSSDGGAIFDKQDGANSGYRLRIDNGYIQLGIYAGNSGNGYTEIVGSTAINDGTWHHVAGTWNGSDMYVYIDGVQDASGTQPAMDENSLPVDIGVVDDSIFLYGLLADLEIWDIARTQTEIQNNMNHSLTGDESGLVGYWRLDSITSDGTIPDYSTNENNGAAFGGVQIRRPDVALLGPFDATETWEDHFIGTGTASSPQFPDMQSLIDAGYTEYLQPGTLSSGYHEEFFDVGTVLDSTQIRVSFSETVVAGSPSMTTTVYWKQNRGDSWQSETGTEVYANNVRYVLIRWDISGSSNDDLVKIEDASARLSVQRKTEEGTVYADAADSGGTSVTLSTDFVSVSSVSATPRGTNNYIPATDWTNPDPNTFSVVLYDTSGSRVSGYVSYTVRGV